MDVKVEMQDQKLILTPETGQSITVYGRDNIEKAMRSLHIKKFVLYKEITVSVSEQVWDNANRGSLQ
jgi:hypothetical protein